MFAQIMSAVHNGLSNLKASCQQAFPTIDHGLLENVRTVPLHEYGWVSHSIPWLRVSSCLQTNNWALRVCVHLLAILVLWKCWLDKISWCWYRTEAAAGWVHLWGRECFPTAGAWHTVLHIVLYSSVHTSTTTRRGCMHINKLTYQRTFTSLNVHNLEGHM